MNRAQRARAAEHITELGKANNIRVRRVSSWEKSGAFRATRIVYVAREMDTVMAYLAALHEFGHILYPPSAKRHERAHADLAVEVTCEAAAWGWALKHVDHHVVPMITPAIRREIGACWTSFFYDHNFRPITVRG